METRPSPAWRTALLPAAPVTLFVLLLFYAWFAVANRYLIFLYEHLGATPFDSRTRTRYWMAGLVAAGLVLILYTGAQWLLGRVAALRGRAYRPPMWQRVWVWCTAALAVGIPLITMTQNWPTLPFSLAAAATATTLLGLAAALWIGELAALRPRNLFWLLVEGAGLLPVLQFVPTLELVGRGLRIPFGDWFVYVLAAGSVLGSAVWLIGVSLLRRWRGRPPPNVLALLVVAFAVFYLALPVLHYTVRGYITLAGNFFALNPLLQLATWGIAVGLVVGVRRVIREA